MKQHKWHKEIKAWADGAEIEMWYGDRWEEVYSVIEWDKDYEFRIKPQPKEPQCKKHKDAPHSFCCDASISEDRYVCECEYWEEPKEPKYLYVYKDSISTIYFRDFNQYSELENYIGKIKLEDTENE